MNSIESTLTADIINVGTRRAVSVNLRTPLPLERFYHWEVSTPNKVCFTQPLGDGQVEEITWAQAGIQIRTVAAYLRNIGVKRGDNVAILSKNCAHWIMADLAIWMAGAVSVPLYPTLSAESVRQIMEHSESKFLFVGKLDDWASMRAGVPGGVQCLSFPSSPPNRYSSWDDIVSVHSPMLGNPNRSHSELATIIYTSGTTGMPKGVMHTFHSMSCAASEAIKIYQANPADRVLSYLPLSHVAERMVVELMQLYAGMQVFFSDSLDTFPEDLQRARPTLFFAVPRIWAKFQSGVVANLPQRKLQWMLSVPLLSTLIRKRVLNALGLDQARLCFSGAAPISADLLRWYQTLGIEILEVYGMTENMGYSHSTREGMGRIGYVGQANPLVKVRIGANGEVLVRSPTMMLGYYKELEKTREVIDSDGFLRTGDVGYVDADERLKITGRIKEIFKTSKGKYVAPFPIESRLLASARVEQCCVLGNAMPQPIALISLAEADRNVLENKALENNPLENSETKNAIEQDLETLLHQINDTLDPHERLQKLVIAKDEWSIESGVMTPTLKIKRNVLETRSADFMQHWYHTSTPIVWQ